MSQSNKLSPKAYDALHEALCSFWYYKPDFKRRLNLSFSDHPKLLAGLDFEQSKRMISEEVINRLSRDEHVYKDPVINALLDLSREDQKFPHLAKVEKSRGQVNLVKNAQDAMSKVQEVVGDYGNLAEERRRVAEEITAHKATAELQASHDKVLESLMATFLELSQSADPHERGRRFEVLLNDLFGLWELDPKAAYSLKHQQIDGAFSFDTDDYLLEAKWWK